MANEDVFHLGIKAVIRRHDNCVLLLKVNTAELRNHSGPAYWDIPGGRLQCGDDIESTLRREVLEETGITHIRSHEFFSAALSEIRIPVGQSRTVGLILFAYLCDVDSSSEIVLSSEHTEFGWFSPSEAADLLLFKYPDEFVVRLASL